MHGAVEGDTSRIGYVDRPFLALFCSNKDYSVGASVTVDCAGGGILENRYRGNVMRIDVAHVVLYTIYDIKRRSRVERSRTPDPDCIGLIARIGRSGSYGKARTGAREG